MYLFDTGIREYVVDILEDLGDSAVITFVRRVNGGRGRTPSDRIVTKDKLVALEPAEAPQEIVDAAAAAVLPEE